MDLNKVIQWFYDRTWTTYSMQNRLGPNSYDCSSAVYFALIAGGFFPADIWIGNTDSLYGDLERRGWVQLPRGKNGNVDVRRGDIFLWGKRGASGGAFGHTGVFIDNANIIHSSYGYNGIHVDDHNWLWQINGQPEYTFYRYVGTPAPSKNDPNDQILDIGSWIKFTKTYRVDNVILHHGIWQVRTNELCKVGFTWDDNGIPAEPLVEVKDGYATPDQILDIGSTYVIPGKYKVLDLGQYQGMWLAMTEWKGLKFWVDVETATEIPSSDAGTPRPKQKPAPKPEPPKPVEPPKEPDPPADPPKDEEPPKEPEDKQETPVKEPNNPKEDSDMAFNEEDRAKLAIQSERVQETLKEIAESDEVKELIGGISRRTKMIVYIVGDTLIGLGLLVPGLAVVFNWGDINQVVALSGIFATAGAFLLTMFGIYKSNK